MNKPTPEIPKIMNTEKSISVETFNAVITLGIAICVFEVVNKEIAKG